MTRQMLAPIALTCGEPGGVGPELAVVARAALPDLDMVWIGDPRHLPKGSAYQLVDAPHQAREVPAGVLPVLAHPFAAENPPGVLVPDNARGVIEVIECAVALAMSGAVGAVCTAPLHKKALKDGAGFAFPGHTEFLQALAAEHLGCAVEQLPVRMMLSNDELRTVLVSIHLSLREALDAITVVRVLETMRITHTALSALLGRKPRIAVAGVNPHAGEGGLFGREEIEVLQPALTQARQEGLDVHGPYAPDTVFMRARQKPGVQREFDVVVAMYHDQGLIPVKYLGVEQGVNVTLGLPLIRTSPDHGTAMDVAGQGRADASSMVQAIRMARQLLTGVTSSGT